MLVMTRMKMMRKGRERMMEEIKYPSLVEAKIMRKAGVMIYIVTDLGWSGIKWIKRGI
jgi:imidazolonepropionase-like amidohydrolase